MSLPPFPVDDLTLDFLEHALGGALTFDAEDGGRLEEPRLVGAEYSLSTLLDFLSGYDESKGILDGYIGDIPCYLYPDQLYCEHDVIRALVAEVRRLRAGP